MFSFPEIDYQRQLIVSSLDDFSPNAALPHVCGGQFGPSPDLWKHAVIEFLCTNVQCGLLEATHRKEISATEGDRLLRELLISGDNENRLEVDIIWNALFFTSTPKLNEILDLSNLRAWEALNLGLDVNFITQLKNLYAKD